MEANEPAAVTAVFPDRPTAEEIAAEYTPERVMRLCRYVARRALGGRQADQDTFDDAVQDAALSFYKRVKQYTGAPGGIIPASYPFYHWLMFRMITDVREIRGREPRRLAGRKVFSLNRRHHDNKITHEQLNIEPEDTEPAIPDTVALRMAVREAVQNLTPRQQQVVEAYYFEHLSQEEIAGNMGIAQPNVNKLLRRARLALKKTLGEDME